MKLKFDIKTASRPDPFVMKDGDKYYLYPSDAFGEAGVPPFMFLWKGAWLNIRHFLPSLAEAIRVTALLVVCAHPSTTQCPPKA